MVDLLLPVPLVGQKVGYSGKPLMQQNTRGQMVPHGLMACWYAAACMVAYYHEAGPRLGLPKVWQADQGLTVTAINSLAQVEGLTVVPKPQGGLTRATVLNLLRAYGPIWAAGHYFDDDPNAAHAIVLTGVQGPFVYYNDPCEPKTKKRPAEWIDANLLSLPNALLAKGLAIQEAEKGLRDRGDITLVSGLLLYRFASSDKPDRWYTSPWWIGQSPYETIERYARENTVTLGWAARRCLAVDPLWKSRCDVLVCVRLVQRLDVWAGTPKTVRSKVGQRYTARWEPDRAVTQLYVYGLSHPSPPFTRPFWRDVFHEVKHEYIPNGAPS